MENKYSNIPPSEDTTLAYLIRLVYQWRKMIALLVGLSLVVSLVTVFLILPVYYKSTAIFYPLNSKAYDPRFIEEPIAYELFGEGEDVDRALSIGKSAEIRDYVIAKYNLAQRYDIDTTTSEGKHRIKNKFESNFEVKENERGAVEVTFFDFSADTAAIVVNDVLKKIDEINLTPTIVSNKALLESSSEIASENYSTIDSMSTKIQSGNRAKQSTYVDDMVSLEIMKNLTLQRQLKRQVELLERKPSTLFVVEKGKPDFKKARPMRMIIVALSLVGTFIFALALAALLENIKMLKEKKMI